VGTDPVPIGGGSPSVRLAGRTMSMPTGERFTVLATKHFRRLAGWLNVMERL